MVTRIFNPTQPYGSLTINGVSMHTYAWNVLDVRPLWVPQAYRGQNVIIPGISGKRAYPIRVDEARHSLPMYLTGHVDSAGTPYSNAYIGLQTNLSVLTAALLQPPAAPTATLAATITMPDSTVASASVQVTGIELGDPDYSHHQVHRAVLHLVVPAGRFV